MVGQSVSHPQQPFQASTVRFFRLTETREQTDADRQTNLVAKDILREYSEFNIFGQLNTGISISSQRGAQQAEQYVRSARQFRAWAQDTITRSNIENYPNDIKQILVKSVYHSVFPAEIAKIVLSGFPDDPHLAISSSELNLYQQLAKTMCAELGTLSTVAAKFHFDLISIPENEIGFDIIIPRSVFDNKTDEYISILSSFSRIASYIVEMTTGSESAPTLIYTSTSDPVTGIAMAYGAAWGFLSLYKLLLEVAEKQLSLLKTIKEFRASSLGTPPDLEEQVKTIVDEALNQAVDSVAASIPTKVPDERVKEINIAIKKDARVVVRAIANGARIGITIESIDAFYDISKNIPDLTPEIIKELLEKQKVLEAQVRQSLALLGQPAPALLSVENSGGDTAK